MVSKDWLIKKLKKELIKIKIYSILWSIPYYITFPLKFIINDFFGRVLMGFAMAHADTTHALKDCEDHHRIMGVTSEEISILYKGRSEEEQRKMFS